MVRRHLHLLGLFALLVALVVTGCRAPNPRPPAPPPQPLVQAPQPIPSPTLADTSTTLAISDKPLPPNGMVIVQQPLNAPVLPAQTVQPMQGAQLTSATVPPTVATSPAPGIGAPVASSLQGVPPTSNGVAPASNSVPVTNTPGANSTAVAVSPLRQLYRECAEKNASLNNYTVMLRRREVVGGNKTPEEDVLLKFRKAPWSVYFKWLGKVGTGREVLYVKDRFQNQILIKTGPGEFPFANMRVDKTLDDPMIKSKSRYPITEAGIGNIIDRFGNMLDADEMAAPQNRMIQYVGPVKRGDYGNGTVPLVAVRQVILPGREPQLPRGGQRWLFFDTNLRLPMMIIAVDERNQEVEYYVYERLSLCLQGFAEDEFNPDALWRRR